MGRVTKTVPMPAEPNPLPPGSVLTAGELADVLKCGPLTLDTMIREGLIPAPAARIGRLVRWPLATIEAWIAGGMKPVGKTESKITYLKGN